MSMAKRIKVGHGEVFPKGAFLKPGEFGLVSPVLDFKADKRPDGSRPQELDKDTGLPLWQVLVLDADEAASKKDTAVTLKIAAKVQPVPPENKTAFPWVPVEFTGLTALPYVEYTGNKNREGKDGTRLAWSFRAEGMVAPGTTTTAQSSALSSSSSGKAA